MTLAHLVVAVVAGSLIGLSLGALGAGGSILAVPVLAFGLGQSPSQATTGSLVVVGVTAAVAAVAARRAGHVRLGPGLGFGVLAAGGAVLGSVLALGVPEDWLLAAFGLLMLLVTALGLRRRDRAAPRTTGLLDTPIVTFHPTFACACPRAAKVAVTATAVGLLTGFLGVGGGFVVVPALTLALGLGLKEAAGTSLVVIAVTSAIAFIARIGHGARPDLLPVLVLTGAAALAAVLGARLAARTSPARLGTAFTALVGLVGVGVTAVALPTLIH